MAVIHQLPRSPRFSTFLSPEAQYALMKGYEDKLYDKIADSNPESRFTLKRNKTPHQAQVRIVDSDPDKGGGSDHLRKESAASSGHDSTSTGLPPAPCSRSFSPENPASPANPARVSASPSNLPAPSPFLRPLRRQSYDVSGNPQGWGGSGVGEGVGHGDWVSSGRGAGGFGRVQRSNSLPVLLDGAPGTSLSHQQRLVMSYRLESAMDILDTLTDDEGHTLSPRVNRSPRPVDAVRDFNCWIRVWNKEFKEDLPAK